MIPRPTWWKCWRQNQGDISKTTTQIKKSQQHGSFTLELNVPLLSAAGRKEHKAEFVLVFYTPNKKELGCFSLAEFQPSNPYSINQLVRGVGKKLENEWLQPECGTVQSQTPRIRGLGKNARLGARNR